MADKCGETSGALVCDREPGHTGAHRGYNDAVDEVLFWRDRLAPAAAEEDSGVDVGAELARIAGILRAFLLAPVSASTLQPVLDLASELNPDLDLALCCSWCGAMIRGGKRPASHGMCGRCSDKFSKGGDGGEG